MKTAILTTASKCAVLVLIMASKSVKITTASKLSSIV